MEKEIKNEELERIVNEVDKNLDKPWRQAVIEIISKQGGTLSPEMKLEGMCSFYTEDGINYVRFYGDYKDKARSMPELKSLIDFLDKGNYQWI
jgi:transcriptional regulator NrdR family protein